MRRRSAAGFTRPWSRSSPRFAGDWPPRLDLTSSAARAAGVFSANVLLTTETIARLTKDGFRVYRHQRVPPNDGGLCLGQLAVAAAWQEAGLVPG